MEKILFAAYHYSILSFVILATYGLGRPLTLKLSKNYKSPRAINTVLTIATGLGIAIMLLFLLGTVGLLNKYTVATLLLAGFSFTVPSIWDLLTKGKLSSLKNFLATSFHKIPWWIIGIVVIPSSYLLIKPLQPPNGWDDVMYHLPYARFWAEQGALTVNEWLRYPLFPYNMNLLYAASLVFDNNILPKMLHAFSIALTAILTYSFAQFHMSKRVAVIAVIQLLIATAWGWGNAYIDMGLMLFWSTAFVALALRYQYGDQRFTYLAVIFAGIALGIKYQALFYLPIFAILAFSIERRVSIVIKSIILFLIIGGYWYIRNFLLSGDPIHPIGGNIFGFSYWSANDLLLQFADFNHRKEAPPWFLCLAVGAFFFWRNSNTIQKGLMLSALACVIVWGIASFYPRYLVSIYPMLAVLSAYFLEKSGIVDWLDKIFKQCPLWLRRSLLSGLLVLAMLAGFVHAKKGWDSITVDEQTRFNYLSERYPGYALLQATNFPRDGLLYQLGFEDEIYYLSNQVRGDVFGVGRYGDIKQVAHNAPALVEHLKSLGVDSLLINIGRSDFVNWPWDPKLLEYFDLIGQSDKAILYKIK